MKIKSITKVDNISKRYDIETETNNFFANEILVHNSLITTYHHKNELCASTRKMACAEGETVGGITFANLFWNASKQYRLKDKLNKIDDNFSFVFELTSPMNRIVTRYDKPDITLIGGRCLDTMRELSITELDSIASKWGVPRPKEFKINSVEELIDLVYSFPAMDEGVVLVIENQNGSHWRLKLKNPKYLAISHLRNNGNISPKRILTLVMANDHHEYLKYFECDKPVFSFVEKQLAKEINEIEKIYDQFKDLTSQKDFALSIQASSFEKWTYNVMFKAKRNGISIKDSVLQIDPKKLSDFIHLKEKISFNLLWGT